MKHLFRLIFIIMLVPGAVSAQQADVRDAGVYRALVPDSVTALGDSAELSYLDSLSLGTGTEANIAAGMAAFLRGSEELGLESLRVAVEQGAGRGDTIAAAALFLRQYEQSLREREYTLNDGSNALVTLTLILIFAAGAAAGIGGAGLVRRWRRRKTVREELKEHFEESDKAGAMLMLALDALQRYREFNVLVERKLAAGQAKDLYEFVAKGKNESRAVETFFENFDRVFLRVYPEYISELNTMLKPDRRFDPEATALTPELRICVLISFGIDNSQKISDLLGLSLNTVYTYRNRLKGRAENRQNIEKDLAALIY